MPISEFDSRSSSVLTNKALNIACLATLLLFLCAYFIKVSALQISFSEDPWITGDWLINYSGGFVRRGLLGEIILRLSTHFLMPPQQLVIALKIFFYAVFCVSIFLLAVKNGFGLIELILFFSPWSIIFDLNDPLGSGRKELLLLSVFAVYALAIRFDTSNNTQLRKKWSFWFLLITLPVLTLTHEGLFFFYQYFLIFNFLNKKTDRVNLLAVAIPYLISLIVLLVLITSYQGTSGFADQICASLIGLGVDKELCSGAIYYLPGYAYSTHIGFYKNYLPTALLTLVSLMCYGISVLKVKGNNFLIQNIVLVIPTLPLYFVAADWGRWIHITALLIFISIIGAREFYRVKFSEIPPIVIFFICVTPYVYVFHWKLPHFIGEYRSAVVLDQNFAAFIAKFF
jgi:hypothetical protein